ncbi:MAG: hypothetical protein IJR89_02760 [Clostridia bacterium]|nr:hypothetical protein [Clostridia bacterium]
MRPYRLFALFLALALCLAVLPVSAEEPRTVTAEAEAPERFLSPSSSVTVPAALDTDALRAAILAGARAQEEWIDLSAFGLSVENDMSYLQDLIQNDMPELCNLADGGYSYSYYSNGIFCALKLRYAELTPEESEARYAAFYAAADRLLDGIRGNGALSETEKALLLHDRLAVCAAYDTVNLYQNDIPHDSYTAYGALVLGTAVCQGYSAAYLYLLREAGIDSELCTSNTINHAWNIVYIGGVPYHVDVTWDDPTEDLAGQVLHDHFLLSTNTMLVRHQMTQADHSVAPTDASYENLAWTRSRSQIVLLDGTLWFLDADTGELCRLNPDGTASSTGTVFSAVWNHPQQGYTWMGFFGRLETDGERLLYSLPDGVYRCDPSSGASEQVAQADLTGPRGRAVFGFALDRENARLVCEIRNAPNDTAGRAYQYFDYEMPSAVAVSSLALSLFSRADGSFAAFAALYPADATDEQILSDAGGSLALYTALPGEASAQGNLFSQPVSFPEVAPGVYKLLLTKAGKHAPRVLAVTVGDTGADLGGIALRLYGDVNDDGAVNAKDALQISRYAAGKSSLFDSDADPETAAYRLRAANVNKDAAVNAKDALQISRYAAGKASQLDLLP